ncbi:NCS2 family permease [Oculatella sp. LEGE 06141]|uniref:NCS2 family permease n=1 Tax=Oculatella sp. LEGE 06141 TaxID=1828648 RepID=UPI00187F63E7|nr:NCS2 family permease [Oculatella sp. LEGE 06141]MBE9182773.1 NCS2 family permease [Oculatella sp. LEGE 06141]
MSQGSTDLEPNQSSSPPPSEGGAIARYFKFADLQTNLRTEIIAGGTTFVTMAYILVVNPAILSNAIFLQESGDLFGELVIATAISAAIATVLMGLLSNYPFALAPGMGLNAFFAFSVVLGLGIDWRLALAAVLVEGIIFILLTLSNIRSQIITAIPECLKRATAAGIGLFIAYIGLSGNPAPPPEGGYGAGIIVANEATITSLGNLGNPYTLMAIAGLLITCAFVARRIKGALLLGILATAILGWILGLVPPPAGLVAVPQLPVDLIGQAFVGFSQLNGGNFANFVAITFVFLFVDLFDTVGTLTGVGIQAGMINERGELPNANRALMADAIGTSAGAMLGTSTVTTYIESAAGVSEGGRSGFTAIVVAILFALSIFFIPLFSAIPAFATAAALVIVGVLMAGNVSGINWSDPAESIPSFLTILIMPLSYSIAEGLAVGFITYPLVKAFQGKAHEISVTVWLLAAVFVLRFVLLALNWA